MLISIQKNPPRNPKDYRIDFRQGLKPYLVFGWAFIIFSVFVLLVPIPLLDVMLFKALFGFPLFFLLGLWFLWPAKKRVAARRIAFEQGTPQTAIVIRHQKVWLPYKSWRDAKITIEVTANGNRCLAALQSSNHALFDKYPLGKNVSCLVDKASCSVLLLDELGLSIND